MHVLIAYFGVVTGSGLAKTKAKKPARAKSEVYMLQLRGIKAMSTKVSCRRQFNDGDEDGENRAWAGRRDRI
jgi:hypothetical protein